MSIPGFSLLLCLSVASLLAFGGFWWKSRESIPTSPTALNPNPDPQLREHARWLAQLRWAAAACVLFLILTAVPVFGLLPLSTLPLLVGWWLVLVFSNAVFQWRIDRYGHLERSMAVQVAVDLVVLTGLLNASGGVENPLYFAYVFPIIVGATLLPVRYALTLTLFGCLLFCLLSVGEALKVLPHETLELFPHSRSVQMPHASHDLGFVAGKGLSLVVLLLVTSSLTALLRRRLRKSEQEVAEAARTATLEHDRLEGMVQAAGVGMITVEPDTKIGWFSRRAADWLGWTDEVRGRICPLLEAPSGCRECVAMQAFEADRPAESVRQLVGGSSGDRYFRHAAAPIHDSDGRVIQVVELVEDITRRKALESEALHTGKLSVLGKLSAGIAHEIGNPIASLMTRLERMERRPDEDFVRESILVLRQQIERIDRTIRNISSFSRQPPERRRPRPINAIVDSALELLMLDPRAKLVRFEKILVEPSPIINSVEDHISQVIVNVLLNAVEALPAGGTVQIESHVSSGTVRLDIIDDGAGLSPEFAEQIFEPFTTTKPRGVGLGLAISKSLILAHAGTIDVASNLGEGTCFSIMLPLIEGPQRSAGVVE